jgi:aspartyl protease family protein
MKRTAPWLWLAAIAWLSLVEPVRTQEYEGCFLLDRQGNLVDLGHLFPSSAPGSSPTENGASGTSSNNPNVVAVPIKRRVAGIPVVDVTFNGRRSYEMLLDTGASGTVITEAMASELNIRRAGTAIIDTASQRGVSMGVGYVASMEMNGIVLRNVPVTIGSDALDIGLLGQDFFGNYDLTIRENTIEFARR